MNTVAVQLRRGRPLTPMQRGLWSSQLRHPDAPVQNSAVVSHLDGAIDPDRFVAAFTAVAAASDALRSRVVDDGTGARIVGGDDPAPTTVIEVPRSEALEWAHQRLARPIDMAVQSHDSVLLRHEDGTWSWYLALHHTVVDAASRAVVFAATAAAYEGTAPTFDSYYEWAAGLDRNPRFEQARDHWRQRTPAPHPDQLYRPMRRPGTQSRRVPVPLDSPLMTQVLAALGGDLRMVSDDLAWTVLLMTTTALHVHRLSGAEHFAIGLPVHNRDAGTRGMVGPLMELYPVDVTIEPGDSVRSLHKRIARSVMTTLRHAVPGTAPAKPDFDVIVNVIPRSGLGDFGSIATTNTWIDTNATDPSNLMRVQLTTYGGVPELSIDLNAAAADPLHLGLAGGHHRRILEAVVTRPDDPIDAFDMVDDAERSMLDGWGMRDEPRPVPEPITVTLGRCLAGAPHVALVDGAIGLTGDELWTAARDAAAGLIDRGVRPGHRVGIVAERSAGTVIAILGVLLAGASYVPIDPAQPEVRRRRLIDRARCVIVLDSHAVGELVSPGESATTTADAPVVVFPAPSLQDEAYLLFTSGSTGEPKGVPITHVGLADYVQFAATHYVAEGDQPVVALFSALTFDLTVTSLFLPLVTGGTMVVVRDDGPAGLAAIAADPSITWLKATPSHLELLVPRLVEGHGLRSVVVGGEAFGRRLARRLVRALPGVAVFNEYGPTEAVVGCMIHRFDDDATPDDEPDVPIGVPAPGVALRVVDAALRPAPVGAAGELCISHRGVTAGYLDPDHDADRFVDFDGRRWYRSGDRVRLIDPDTLVYLGRADEQMKVGGIRLDPGEIEAALETHPAVAAAVVRLWSPSAPPGVQHCERCGLASNVPGITFDEAGICSTCHAYERVRVHTADYFGTPDDLATILAEARARRTGDHDCLVLLSGGKDSTYALHRLVDMGFEVFALTLDNGFISEQAKANIARTIAALGVDHEFATSEAMIEIFRDSLERHSNVCHGCYKTIYTLGTTRAAQLGAPVVVTGLSRGQLFETRLIPAQFSDERFDVAAIDRAVVEARKVYHRIDDAPNRLLDTTVFDDDDIFERISYVDFYRYVDVELAEMFDFLDRHAPWVRPTDTGRSTNCLINAAGIHVHRTEQGYHNYAEPYAWDVRLGHKTRDEALDELDDELDPTEVGVLLDTVGYRPRRREILTAWLRLADHAVVPSPAELRALTASLLPAHAVPSAFVIVETFPVTANGKLDADALPAPDRVHRPGSALHVEPGSPLETAIVTIWERILGIEPIGALDDFFDLGGDSLAALEMAMAVGTQLGSSIREEIVFTHTTPRSLAHHLEGALLPGDAEEVPATAADAGRPGEAEDTLTPLEAALLFDASADDTGILYNVAHRYHASVALDPDQVVGAVRTIVGRHRSLHVSYAEPRRALPVDDALEIVVIAEAVAPAAARDALVDLQSRRLDVRNGPIIRALVARTHDGGTTLGLVVHHVAIDAAGFEVLWRELDELLAGRELAPLAHLTAPLESYDAHASAEHWAAVLDSPPGASLAFVGPRPAEPDGYLRRRASVSAPDLRHGPGSTSFATAMAAFAATLARHTGGGAGDRSADGLDTAGERVEFAISVSTRGVADTGHVGYRLNLLPVRLDIEADDTWVDLATRAGAVLGAALGHRRQPFAEMVGQARARGTTVMSPRVILSFDQLDVDRLAGLPVEHEIVSNGIAVTDLTVFVQVAGAEVHLAVEYRGSVMGAAGAAALLDLLDAALVEAIAGPASAVGTFASERSADSILHGDPLDAPEDLWPLIAGHLLAAAEGRLDSVAVRCGTEAMTWAQLDTASAAVAERLAGSGVVPGDSVIVCVPRSPGAIVAIVGAMRAGAAYVPLDPGHPGDRLRHVAGLAGASAALVTEATAELIDQADLATIVIDDGGRLAQDGPAGAIGEVAPDHAAYVIFTSGSTGEPRAVTVSRRQLAASTAARTPVYGAAPAGFLVVSSLAFDSSVTGVFWALATGAAIVLPTEREVHDVDALVGLMADEVVNHTLMVPSLYAAVLDRSALSRSWPSQVIVAGEACPAALVGRHHELWPSSRLTNEYGPTETTVWATFHHCAPGEDPVPIGRPIPGAWVAVTDRHGRARPIGVAGELVIGGAGVTDGASRPERFGVRSRLGEGRSFATGDLVVWDGHQLLFLGRIDNQLNVGGARVEPEEVEQVIGAVPGVVAVVVGAADPRTLDTLVGLAGSAAVAEAIRLAAGADDPGSALRRLLLDSVGAEPVLVAHIETGGSTLDVGAVREALRRGLPPALRPTILQLHDRLPRTPNDKVDRAAAAQLPVTIVAPPTTSSSDDPTAIGAAIELFTTVLGHGDIDADRDFVSSGGSSLSALRLAAAIETGCGVVVPLADIVEGLTPRDLAARIETGTSPASARTDQVTVSADERFPFSPSSDLVFPLSPSQERLWIHQQVRGTTVPYVVSLDLEVVGVVDVDALTVALDTVVRRHPALRTRVVVEAGLPTQVVHPADGDHGVTLERAAVGADAADVPTAGDLAAAFVGRPFDLEHGPLVRVLLIDLDDDAHRLVIAAHHIVMDGESLRLVLEEIADEHELESTQRAGSTEAGIGGGRGAASAERPEPAVRLGFGDVARWQRARMAAPAMVDRLEYWRTRLAGAKPVALPARRANTRPEGRVITHEVALPAEAVAALAGLADRLQLSPFQYLVALGQLWLSRVTGADDISVGAPITERRDPRLDGIVGPFVNLAVFRATIDPSERVEDRLRRARREIAEAVDHADVPFDMIVRALRPDRPADGLPFFDVTCSVYDSAIGAPRPGGITWRAADDAWFGGLITDLMIEAILVEGRPRLVLRHDPGVLDGQIVAALARSFGAMVAAAAMDPGQPVGDLPLLDEHDLAEILAMGAGPVVPFDEGQRLDERVAEVAAARPDAVALSTGPAADGSPTAVTYRELVEAADSFAATLRGHDVGSGDVVAVALPRSIDLVVTILAIVRCGAAYAPLDIAAPPERSAIMREAAGACGTVLPGFDFVAHRVEGAPDLPASTPVACVMFTSGSTGRPKGAMVTHRGIQRLVRHADYARLDETTVMGMGANPAFDALTWEIWGTLANGGRLEILDADDLLDPDRFASAIVDRAITTMVVPTSLFNLVSRTRPDTFATMRDLLVGGEALDPAAVARVLAHRPERFVNAYGPTECAVIAATGEVLDVPVGAASIPIGVPIVNTTIDIVDHRGHLVPLGVEGEIEIGGAAVAAGYIGEPERTAERFGHSAVRPDHPVYRTGDIARRLPDGRIDFIGRRDGQIKLRGLRIELGEIERTIVEVDGIAAAACSVVGAAEHRRIVAHVVTIDDAAANGAPALADRVRRHVAASLPAAMVPTEVWSLTELPLTATGKLDRRALESDAASRAEAAPAAATPTDVTPAVAAMCRRWQELLGAAAVGPDDDFFALGGHSLLAVSLLAGLERDHGMRPPLSVLFSARTPRQLVLAIGLDTSIGADGRPRAIAGSSTTESSTHDPVVVLRAGMPDRVTPLWLMHPAGGNHLLYEPLAARLHPELPVRGVEAVGVHGEAAPLRTVEELADHQFRWIRRSQPVGPYRLVGYSIGGLVGLEVARRLVDIGETVEYLGAVEAGAPGAAQHLPDLSRSAVYRRHLRNRNWGAITHRLQETLQRRAEEAAVSWLGVRPSARQIDENVRMAMVDAFCAYEGAPLDIAVELVLGYENPDEVVANLERAWRRLAHGGVTLRRIHGDHDTVLVDPWVGELAAVLDRSLRPDADDGARR